MGHPLRSACCYAAWGQATAGRKPTPLHWPKTSSRDSPARTPTTIAALSRARVPATNTQCPSASAQHRSTRHRCSIAPRCTATTVLERCPCSDPPQDGRPHGESSHRRHPWGRVDFRRTPPAMARMGERFTIRVTIEEGRHIGLAQCRTLTEIF